MNNDPTSGDSLLEKASAAGRRYLQTVKNRHVCAQASGDSLRELLSCELPESGDDDASVIDLLIKAGTSGTVASQSPRYFGFVTGGSLRVATAADWLVSAWDQNAQLYTMSPIASVVEDVAARWLKELMRVPQDWSVGFVTGAQMATFTSLLAARHYVLEAVGWDVERSGLFQSPNITVIVSSEAHRTIFTALRMLGIGDGQVRRVNTDGQGRMIAEHFENVLGSCVGPTIVCAQAGNVNTGGVDPLEAIARISRERGAWLHVDGAFGAWLAASPAMRHLVSGMELADSIATDAHKWLNVPYDSGIVLTAHPEAHRASLTIPAHYLQSTEGERDPRSFTPDESRRARGVPVYAALRALGKHGVREQIERCCRCARQMAELLRRHSQVRILNQVTMNQVLVQFVPPDENLCEISSFTDQVIEGVQREGTCWLGSTRWQEQRAARISVCNWSTSTRDIERSAVAILEVLDRVSRAKAVEG